MNYLILVLFIFLLSCSNNKDLIDVEYYMKQGKEISFLKKNDFNEIKKINKLELSTPITVKNWLSYKFNTSNYLPRFQITNDFTKNASIDLKAKSFLAIKNNIYIVDNNSDIIVLDENLKILKKKNIYKKKIFKDYILEFSMTTDGKLIYISDNLGNVHALEVGTLKIKWYLKLGVPIISKLYLNNNNLFFINVNSKLYSVNSLDGKINWSHETPSKIVKEQYQISISNNLLFTNNDYGEIYCYDLSKKKISWKLSLSDQDYQIKFKNFKIGYIVSNEGILYFSSNYGETMAVEAASGKIIWKKLLSSTNLPIINSDYFFLINESGFFYILKKKNGEIVYSIDLNKLSFNKEKNKTVYHDIFLGKNYIYFINSGKNLIKLDINNLTLIKLDKQSLDKPKDFFVLNNYLYILQDKKLSKFYN